eukprot:10598334-Heterocapsa_arctica.AAC.1
MLRAEKKDLRKPTGPDRDAIEVSHAAYTAAGLPRAPEKGFGFARTPADPSVLPHGEESFTVWGTEVKSEVGTAAAPVGKRAELFCLACSALPLPREEKEVLRRLVGNFVFLFMHRRECMSSFHRIYKAMT